MDCIAHTTKEKAPGFDLVQEEPILELQLTAIFKKKNSIFILFYREVTTV